MKAIQIIRPEEIILTEIPFPSFKSDNHSLNSPDVLVKVLYAGFCGSDLNTFLGKNALSKTPVIPGHEIGGVIEATGMPCTIIPYTTCGHCSSCRNGRPNACRYNQTLGVQRDGAMCEYVVVPADKVIADAAMTPEQFCFVEPMSVGFHAVDRGDVTDRDVVMILGCGMIGVGAVISAARLGAQVIVVDIDEGKLSVAQQLGATYTINPLNGNTHEQLQTITDGRGPDVVIEAAGLPATYQMAVNEVAFTGRVVCIGYAKEPVTFDTKHFVQKELDIRGSRNATPKDFYEVMAYFKKNVFPLNLLISGIYKPEQAGEALRRWITEPARIFRILIDFNM
jgi:2-desacetyl-2-hydroxyethyl bacteriochlorophyllide A dehydrogenase